MLPPSTNPFIPQVPNDTLADIINSTFYVLQAVCCVYFLTCVFWWAYIIRKICSHFNQRVQVVRLFQYSANQEGSTEDLARLDDSIVRDLLYLICVVCGIMFTFSINTYGVYFITTTLYLPSISVSIGRNCSLVVNSFLAEYYDFRIGSLILNLLSCLKTFSFSMMLWLFTICLLHRSNKLRLKTLIRLVSIAILINIITAVLAFIPCTMLLGKIVQSLLDSYCVYISYYIAVAELFPSINRQFAEGYNHYRKRDYQLRKIFVSLIIFSFGIYIHSYLCVFMLHAILDTVSLNPCWFNATYGIPMFELSESVVNTLVIISTYLLLFYRVIEVFVLVCFTLLSLVSICKTCLCTLRNIYHTRQTYPLELSGSLLTFSN